MRGVGQARTKVCTRPARHAGSIGRCLGVCAGGRCARERLQSCDLWLPLVFPLSPLLSAHVRVARPLPVSVVLLILFVLFKTLGRGRAVERELTQLKRMFGL